MSGPTDEEWDAWSADEREEFLLEQDAEAEALAREASPEEFAAEDALAADYERYISDCASKGLPPATFTTFKARPRPGLGIDQEDSNQP